MSTAHFWSITLGTLFLLSHVAEKPALDLTSYNEERQATVGMAAEQDSIKKEEPIFVVVDTLPKFPDGHREMWNYIRQNVRYPAADRKAKRSGVSHIRFVVHKNGYLSDFKIEKGKEDLASETMHLETIRVLSKMPNWIPGKLRGKIVSCYYTIPVKFTLR